MEIRSLEEFDRAFFARYGTAGDVHGAAGDASGAANNVAYGAAQPISNDPFLRETAFPRADGPAAAKKPGPRQILYAVVSYTIIALLVVGILGFVLPLAFKVKLLNVESGSMQPYYNVGTLVWVVPTKFEKIKVGDDVTYQLGAGLLSTHRVKAIDKENQKLTVQGTHNSDRAELIGYEQVQGVVRFHIHGVGPAMAALSGEQGIFITISLILGILVLWGGSYLLSKKKAGEPGGNTNPRTVA